MLNMVKLEKKNKRIKFYYFEYVCKGFMVAIMMNLLFLFMYFN